MNRVVEAHLKDNDDSTDDVDNCEKDEKESVDNHRYVRPIFGHLKAVHECLNTQCNYLILSLHGSIVLCNERNVVSHASYDVRVHATQFGQLT